MKSFATRLQQRLAYDHDNCACISDKDCAVKPNQLLGILLPKSVLNRKSAATVPRTEDIFVEGMLKFPLFRICSIAHSQALIHQTEICKKNKRRKKQEK